MMTYIDSCQSMRDHQRVHTVQAGLLAVLTPERILEAAEDVIRRFGPAKATVVDVARALGVSHGTVYRHFASKAALRDAVSSKWLKRISDPLATIAASAGSPRKRLRQWFDALIGLKRTRALEDPELFAAYAGLAAETNAVAAHVAELTGQLERIVGEGMSRGEFAIADPDETARALFDATARFHDPSHAAQWTDARIDAAFECVWQLVSGGLEVRA
jgi:AcrR family transcriptional regulator